MRSSSETYTLNQVGSRDGIVSIDTRLRVECSRVRMPVGARDFSLLQGFQSASGTRPGTGDISVDNAAGDIPVDNAAGA
jgi:hypothetical protein